MAAKCFDLSNPESPEFIGLGIFRTAMSVRAMAPHKYVRRKLGGQTGGIRLPFPDRPSFRSLHCIGIQPPFAETTVMATHIALSMIAAAMLLSDVNAQAPAKPRLDSLGDPLPDGAIARLGTRRLKTVGLIDSASFSPDGKRIVALASGMLHVWDAATGKELDGPWKAASVSSFAFSPTSSDFVTVSNTGNPGVLESEITVWTLDGLKRLKAITGHPNIRAVALADQGQTVVCADETGVRWLDVDTGKERRVWQLVRGDLPPDGLTVVLSPDSKSLAVGILVSGKTSEGDAKAVVFDLVAEKPKWHAQAPIGPEAFSLLTASGQHIFSGTMWNCATPQQAVSLCAPS